MATDQREAKGPDLGMLGGNSLFRYWNDLASVSIASVQEQSLSWVALWQDAVLGRTSPERMRDQWTSAMSSWMSLARFPYEWWASQLQGVPSVVFVLDQVAEAPAEARSVRSPVNVKELELECTPLYRVAPAGAHPEQIEAHRVKLAKHDDGARVSVTLEGSGSAKASSARIQPGAFVGVVYAVEQSARYPVAVVQLFVH